MMRIYKHGAIPLSCAPCGVQLKVVDILARGRGQIRRLMEIGLVPGSTLVLISNELGPIIIEVKGARFALGRGIANRIMVEVLK